MQIDANSPEDYIRRIPPERQHTLNQLRDVLQQNLPKGFTETMGYGMIAYVVPHELYPAGYHVDPSLPLPFINLASQKNYIALYHMGLYADTNLLRWFETEYPKHITTKLDMGKSCIRFKKPEQIPFDLIGKLVAKMEVADWIALYESQRAQKKA